MATQLHNVCNWPKKSGNLIFDANQKNEIGRGSYGAVYSGKLDGRPVAVKKIHSILFQAPENDRLLREFEKECGILKSLHHPNVVKLLGTFRDDGDGPLLVMEVYEENLKEYLTRNKGKLSVFRQLEIAKEVTEGLCFLHRNNIVHRDLKLENILVGKDGHVRIGDFGQSKLLINIVEGMKTTQPGTVQYMPPEALKEGTTYKANIDVFSLGVVFICIATQREPTTGIMGIGHEVELKRRSKDLRAMAKHHPLEPLIRVCLRDDPGIRPDVFMVHSDLNLLSVRHLPGSSSDNLYTSIDISAKMYSPKAERRLLPSPPPERENEMAGKVAEYRKALEMSSGTKPEVKESDDSSQMYIYVDHKKPIALKSMSEQGWYKVVHRENGEGNGDVSNDRASDYFNVKSRAASERELKKQTEKLTHQQEGMKMKDEDLQSTLDDVTQPPGPPQRLPPSKPQPYRNKEKPTNPSPAVGRPNPSNSSAVGVSKPTPPPKLFMKEVKNQSFTQHLSAPVTQKPHVTVSMKDVLARKSFWYKPNSSRDAASELMMKSQPGYFIVRDSSTVTGGYALTIRLGEDAIRAKLKLPPDIEVTNDMCVKHFLIQPDAKGVRLQGWNEPPFNDLEDFIYHHCQERYCLPIELVLPTADLMKEVSSTGWKT